MDDFRIYDKSLSSEEIYSIYEMGAYLEGSMMLEGSMYSEKDTKVDKDDRVEMSKSYKVLPDADKTYNMTECGGEDCWSGGLGECNLSGVMICVDGVAICNATNGTPIDEICDGLDNDCDGKVDDKCLETNPPKETDITLKESIENTTGVNNTNDSKIQ